jgi:predicted transport protein
MATVKSNLKDLSQKLTGISKDVKILAEVGQFMVKRIQGFTRLGYSLSGNPEDPKSNPLKPLSSGYIKYRQRLSKGLVKFKGPTITLDSNFKANRSQLTVTGQLLKSLAYSASPQEKSVKVFVSSSRRSDGENNRDVARDVSSFGRPFIGLDKKGLETIKIRYIKALKRRLK